MKNNLRTAFFAAAFCALAAAPAAFAGDPALPVADYVKYAKLLNGAAPADSTNTVKSAIAEVVKAAGESARQAVGEIAAALAAVSTVKAENDDSATAASLFQNVVAAAAAAGSDKAESLGFAKIAAAAGALVSGAADYTEGAGAGLSKKVANEVKAALGDTDGALSGLDPFAMKNVYETSVKALRSGSYKMKEDSDAVGPALSNPETAAGASSEIGTGRSVTDFSDFDSPENPRQDGVYVGSAVPAPVPAPVVPKKKKGRQNPTKNVLE